MFRKTFIQFTHENVPKHGFSLEMNGSQIQIYTWKPIKCKQTADCKQTAESKQTADNTNFHLKWFPNINLHMKTYQL